MSAEETLVIPIKGTGHVAQAREIGLLSIHLTCECGLIASSAWLTVATRKLRRAHR